MLEKLSQISLQLDAGYMTCFDILQCMLNLNDTDMRILQMLLKSEGMTSQQISKRLKKDRSTIHRSLEKLSACQLCYKKRQSGAARGFVDYYFVIPEQDILRKAENNLDVCYSKIKAMFQELKKEEKPGE
jgi:predicted transcriptional regulator